MELEMLAAADVSEAYEYEIGASLTIDVREMFRAIVSDLKRNIPKEVISAKFHNTVADFIVATCEHIRNNNEINQVVLSGGIFQNRYLLTEVCRKLAARGFAPHFHKRIPTNDGGISLGQAVIANARSL